MRLKKDVKPTEQEVAILTWLGKNNIGVKITHIGASTEPMSGGEEPWEHDSWAVTVSRPTKKAFTSDYHTGTGHRVLIKPMPQEVVRYPRTLHAEQWMRDWVRPHPPEVAAVLNSFVMDGDACNQSFEDWADDFGYDKDSRRAEKTYEACKEIGFKMRQIFTRAEIEEIRTMLEDY